MINQDRSISLMKYKHNDNINDQIQNNKIVYRPIRSYKLRNIKILMSHNAFKHIDLLKLCRPILSIPQTLILIYINRKISVHAHYINMLTPKYKKM